MFREVLQDILDRTEGCRGVAIMGFDGIVVEQVWKNEATDGNYDVAVAEYTSFVVNVKRKNSDLGLGKLNEIIVSTDLETIILRIISEDYFLAMILTNEGNFGRGRFEMRRAELFLANEFVI